MLAAAVQAIRTLAHQLVPEVVLKAYGENTSLQFGPNYILPKPFDPRLSKQVPLAVAKAAIETGVAQIPLPKHYLD